MLRLVVAHSFKQAMREVPLQKEYSKLVLSDTPRRTPLTTLLVTEDVVDSRQL